VIRGKKRSSFPKIEPKKEDLDQNKTAFAINSLMTGRIGKEKKFTAGGKGENTPWIRVFRCKGKVLGSSSNRKSTRDKEEARKEKMRVPDIKHASGRGDGGQIEELGVPGEKRRFN